MSRFTSIITPKGLPWRHFPVDRLSETESAQTSSQQKNSESRQNERADDVKTRWVSFGDCFKVIKKNKKTCASLIGTQSKKIIYKTLIVTLFIFFCIKQRTPRQCCWATTSELRWAAFTSLRILCFECLIPIVLFNHCSTKNRRLLIN